MSVPVRLSIVLCASLSAHAAGFAPPQHYPVGKAPVYMVLADFNHDGKTDIATSNILSHDVSILLGNGDGTFQKSKSYQAAPDRNSSALGLAAGDFNEDGKVDLVVVLGDSSTMMASLLLGKGDGTFSPLQLLNTGSFAETIVAADFNSDKHLDLFFGGAGGSTVMLGNGNGTFQAPVSYSTGGDSRITGLVSVDLNGDGQLDVVAVNQATQSVGILLGRGDGSFLPVRTFSVGVFPYYVVAADFDHDGKMDLALTYSSGGTVEIYLGNGDGTFQLTNSYQVGTRALYMAAVDLDVDGNTDLVVGTYRTGSKQSGSIGVLYGTGDGQFDQPLFYRAAPDVWAVSAGKFNSDTNLDVAVTVPGPDAVNVLINNGR